MKIITLVATAILLTATAATARQPTKKSVSSVPAAASTPPWSQEPTSFLGLTLGGGFPDDLSDCPVLPAGGPDYRTMLHGPSCLIRVSDEIVHMWKPPALGMDYSETVFLYQGKIRSIHLDFNTRNFDDAKVLLVTKYGQPGSKSVIPVETLAGGNFTSERDVWQGNHVLISIDERAQEVDRGVVTVTDIELLMKVQGDKSKADADAAAKL